MNAKLPTPEWLLENYNIPWDGNYSELSGYIADVVRFRRMDTDETCVMRVSNPRKLSRKRLSSVHRFQAFLESQSVLTVAPVETPSGETFMTTESGLTLEIYAYVEGREPTRGQSKDIRLVAKSVAELHNAGLDYVELPGEESLYQNHLALNQLLEDVRKTRVNSKGKAFHDLYLAYAEETEDRIEEIESLRSGLIETCLHLDTGPQNMIVDKHERLWFIDCDHMTRGRRIFEVCVSTYYLNPGSIAPLKAPARYDLFDPEVDALFLSEYRAHCEPPWSSEETRALNIERVLLLIHGVTCWTTMWNEETVRDELVRFLGWRQKLKAAL